MAQYALVLPFLLVSTLTAVGQWALGPMVDLAMFNDRPIYLAPGIGASAAYLAGKRMAWTAGASIHLAHATSFTWVQGPLNLPTGDTTSATWRGETREGHVKISIGFQRTFNSRQRHRAWFWNCALGYGIDRTRFIADEAELYSGEDHHYDDVRRDPCMLILVGGGSRWKIGNADLIVGLASTGAWFLNAKHKQELSSPYHSLALSVDYRWRL